ncbi:MAG TPA: hypothetical protein VM580_21280, partial [Labilithrix sp.]|nr:hypothetical protein [Labilithrix sp.]
MPFEHPLDDEPPDDEPPDDEPPDDEPPDDELDALPDELDDDDVVPEDPELPELPEVPDEVPEDPELPELPEDPELELELELEFGSSPVPPLPYPVPSPVRESLVQPEQRVHPWQPSHERHDGPLLPLHLPWSQACEHPPKKDEQALNGLLQPSTFTSRWAPLAGASFCSFVPDRHRFSDRTHASFSRNASAAPKLPLVLAPVGGMHPSAFTHSAIVEMLVSARTQSCSARRWSSSKNRHSLRPSGKSSVALSSHVPLDRHPSHRPMT